MTGSKSWKTAVVVAAAIAIPVFANGCSAVNDAQNAVCCKEFAVGGTVDVKNIGGSVESQVIAQSLADISGIAAASIDDLTTACRGIATDMEADPAKRAAADANDDKNAKMKAWCDLAVSTVTSAKATAGGTLSVDFKPPVCSASVSAKLDCQAQCSGSASCDFKANPPTCSGGKLTVSCKGDCTASAGASVSCEGSCSAHCSGSCTAQGGVDCTGKCEGTCTAKAGVGTGTGAQADGTCNGTCSGTCSITPPGVTCSGSCSGGCEGTCKGSATASVKCDGTCAGDFEPISCTGGTLEGGCKADAKCEGSCDGSVQAKAECTPPSLSIVFAGAASADVATKLSATLEANLPVVLTIKERFVGVAKATGSLTGNISAVTDLKAACLPAMGDAAVAAVADIQAAGSATVSLAGTINLQ